MHHPVNVGSAEFRLHFLPSSAEGRGKTAAFLFFQTVGQSVKGNDSTVTISRESTQQDLQTNTTDLFFNVKNASFVHFRIYPPPPTFVKPLYRFIILINLQIN